jgi:hypothetical protein
MYLIQGIIIFAVVASNIHWQWTTNPYLASGLGMLLAWMVTVAIVTEPAILARQRLAGTLSGTAG